MSNHNEDFICGRCDSEIYEDDEFCPNCGNLFEENITCTNHPEKEADGVCLVCNEAFCSDCAGWVGDVFLCEEHSEYEIYEGMARVFGTSDVAQAHFASGCLKQGGLHPFIYSRKASPLHLGGADYSLFQSSGEFDGRIINEIKVMVPLNEAIEAEKILEDLDLIS